MDVKDKAGRGGKPQRKTNEETWLKRKSMTLTLHRLALDFLMAPDTCDLLTLWFTGQHSVH